MSKIIILKLVFHAFQDVSIFSSYHLISKFLEGNQICVIKCVK